MAPFPTHRFPLSILLVYKLFDLDMFSLSNFTAIKLDNELLITT